MIYECDREKNCMLSDTLRSAKIISDIANNIEWGIQVTDDTPEGNEESRLLVLDLKVW